MLELEGGRIGQPCEKLSPLHLTTLLVPSIDVKTLFLGSSRLAAHGGGRLASQIVLLHDIFCFWCHALVTRDKAVNAPPTPLPWCSPARFIPPLGSRAFILIYLLPWLLFVKAVSPLGPSPSSMPLLPTYAVYSSHIL